MTDSEVNRHRKAKRKYCGDWGGWRPGQLARGTLAMVAGMGLRNIVQAAVFFIIARVLGIADYGAYAAILGISTAIGCFSGWGTQALMVRDVSRNRDRFATAWGRTLAAIAISSPILFVVFLGLAWAVLPARISLTAIAFIGLGDLVFAPVGLAAVTAFQGHDRLGRTARLTLAPVLPRFAGALALPPMALVFPEVNRLSAWAFLYAVASLAATLYSWRMVRQDLGPPLKISRLFIWNSIREGIAFAFGSAAFKLYTDIDKTMLARLSSMEAAGAYSAGYRVTDLAAIPIASLLSAAMPSFFRSGEGGLHAALAYTHRILFAPLAYSIIAGIALYLCAGMLPLLLGATYADAVPALKWLAWLPFVSLPRLLLQTLLIGGDRQNDAAHILAGGVVFNIALNLWLIPSWSWRGAVTATYAAEILMALAMSAIAFFPQTKPNPPASEK